MIECKFVLFFNKRGKGFVFDLIKVEEIELVYGGELLCLEVLKVKNRDFMFVSFVMLEEGYIKIFGVKYEWVMMFFK